jgi:hypothetical protein
LKESHLPKGANNEKTKRNINFLRHKNELAEFLQWPEFQFWNGFIQLEKNDTNISNNNESETDQLGPILSRFFFSTAAFGAELKEWSKREQLLSHWRRVADSVSK